jgi:surface protein
MDVMFIGASAVNQDIGSWNVSRVANMESTFYEADTFNQDIGSWDVMALEWSHERVYTDQTTIWPKLDLADPFLLHQC